MLKAKEQEKLAELFKMLGEPNRLAIALCCCKGPCSVSDIAEKVKISNTLTSHHLRLLRAARVLQPVRKGKQVFYALADDHVRDMMENMVEHISEHHEVTKPRRTK
jgi:DNA-binding transcriptional ArsR family regulator